MDQYCGYLHTDTYVLLPAAFLCAAFSLYDRILCNRSYYVAGSGRYDVVPAQQIRFFIGGSEPDMGCSGGKPVPAL